MPPTKHPLYPILPPEETLATWQAAGQRDALLADYLQRREVAINAERTDPLRNFYIQPMLWFAAALMDLDLPCFPAAKRQAIRDRLGVGKRRFPHIFLLGCNRSGKTTIGAFLANQILANWHNRHPRKRGAKVIFCQETEKASVAQQQPEVYNLFPAELKFKKTVKNPRPTYISYTEQTGFGPAGFTWPNYSNGDFRYYAQGHAALQGLSTDFGLADEACPVPFFDTLKMRAADRAGYVMVTYTPIDGWTPLVARALEGAETILTVPAFLLPTDGGPIDVPRALGFHSPEDHARAQVLGPDTRPYDLDRWLAGGPIHAPVPPGRKFETLPIVAIRHDEDTAVVFSHINCNPYCNPTAVLGAVRLTDRDDVKRRIYGYTEKSVARMFAAFDRKVHVIPDDQIPQEAPGDLRVQITDPAKARQWFSLWALFTKHGVYIYREWPGSYDIPGQGVPGPWVIPSDDAKKYDGKKGPGQRSFGWGVSQHKREIARLEGWADYKPEIDCDPNMPEAKRQNFREVIKKWNPRNGARERVHYRYIDSRASQEGHVENARVVTLLEDLNENGLPYNQTAGLDIDKGQSAVERLLEYDKDQPISFVNSPLLHVAASCKNIIYCLENYTGNDGETGAGKDIADTLRYLATTGHGWVDPARLKPQQPGCL